VKHHSAFARWLSIDAVREDSRMQIDIVRPLVRLTHTSEDLIERAYDQPEQLIRGAVRREILEKLDE